MIRINNLNDQYEESKHEMILNLKKRHKPKIDSNLK